MFSRPMSLASYRQLTADARVLEAQSFGVKVWLLPDGRIMKLFRLKGYFSSGRLYPYNLRFARNARRLQARGIAAPTVGDVFFCKEIKRHGVIYDLLEGESFHNMFAAGGDDDLYATLAGFLAELHRKGVYFRSVHPGNVLLRPDGSMGLIDVQDVRFWPWPLNTVSRARNFRHLFNSDSQSLEMRAFGFGRFVDLYLNAVGGSPSYKRRLKSKIMAYDNAWKRPAS
ncbi:hypothetical protein [Thiolapillus sp.]